MRLIDADALLEKILWLPSVNGIPATVNHNRPLIDIAQAVEAINESVTAYDVDKLVEQIEDFGKYKGVLRSEDGKHCDNYLSVTDAKRIVKGGGKE